MAWVTPKINWTKTDRINYADYNRIKNNLAYLRDMAGQLYQEFNITVDPDKDKYSLWPYPSPGGESGDDPEPFLSLYNGTAPDVLRQRSHYRLAGAGPPGIGLQADPRQPTGPGRGQAAVIF